MNAVSGPPPSGKMNSTSLDFTPPVIMDTCRKICLIFNAFAAANQDSVRFHDPSISGACVKADTKPRTSANGRFLIYGGGLSCNTLAATPTKECSSSAANPAPIKARAAYVLPSEYLPINHKQLSA
jgi:hypothetical protein